MMQTPRPKSSFADVFSDINLSSIINFVSYIVAVNAPPDSTLPSIMFVSCKSKVVSPRSNFISLELAKFSEPITNLVPRSFKSRVVPNFIFVCELGALIVCCKV